MTITTSHGHYEVDLSADGNHSVYALKSRRNGTRYRSTIKPGGAIWKRQVKAALVQVGTDPAPKSVAHVAPPVLAGDRQPGDRRYYVKAYPKHPMPVRSYVVIDDETGVACGSFDVANGGWETALHLANTLRDDLNAAQAGEG